MTFRSIKVLADEVLRKVESERAAVKVAQGIAASHPGEETRGSPTLCTDAPAPSDLNGLPVYIAPRTGKRATGPTGSQEVSGYELGCELNLVARVSGDQPEPGVNSVVRQRTLPAAKRPVLALVISNKCEPTHRPIERVPARRVGSHLVLVGGLTHLPAHRSADG